MTTLKESITNLYSCVLRGDLEGVKQLVTADFIDHAGRPDTPSGLFSMVVIAAQGITPVPSMGLTIDDMIEEGNRVAVRWSLEAMRLQERERGPVATWVQANGITIYRVEDGRVAERWAAISV